MCIHEYTYELRTYADNKITFPSHDNELEVFILYFICPLNVILYFHGVTF